MKPLVSRPVLVAAAALVQLALVPLAVIGQVSARWAGEEYALRVEPVDPIDPFRGAYVALSYPDLPQGSSTEARDDLYVPLVRSGNVWLGAARLSRPPEDGPFLRCRDTGWRLTCGIESWFLPQDAAYAMEQAVGAGRAVARVRIDARGNAALVGVDVDGG